MGKNGGGIVRDVYMLASFACLMASAAVLFILLCRYPSMTANSNIMNLVPDRYRNDIGLFRLIIIIISSLVLGLSLFSFLGSLCRSSRVIKTGLNITILVIACEIAVLGWFYFKDPTFEKASHTIWSNMPEDQKQKFMTEVRCDSEQSCRQQIKTALVESHPQFLMFTIVGIVAFQLISLVFGCFILGSIRSGRKNCNQLL